MLDPQCAQSSVVSPNRSIGAETHYGIASKCSRYLGVWRERRLLLTPATLSQPPTLRTFRAPPEGANAQPTETLSLAGASVLTCPRQLAPRRFADDAAHFFVVVTAESERGVFFCVPSELLAREHWRSLSKVLRPLRELEARNADLADWVGQLQGTLRAVAIERRLEELLDMEADIEAQMDIADVKDGLDTRATLESDLCAVRAEVEQLRQVIELTPAIAQPLDQDDSYEAFGAEQAENAYVDFVPFSSARKSSRPATPDDSTRSSEKLKKLDSKNEMKATPKQESLNVCASASPTPSEPTVGVSRDSAGLSSPWWKSLFRVHGFDEVLS